MRYDRLTEQVREYLRWHYAAAAEPMASGSQDYTELLAEVCRQIPRMPGEALATPAVVEWEVTCRCNCRCIYCYHRACSRAGKSLELGTDAMLRCVDQMRDCNVLGVRMEGGEPFLRTDLLPVLHRLRQHRIGVFLSTNGTLLNDRIAERVARVLDPVTSHVQVSLDGPSPAVQDPIVGDGSFDRALRGLMSLSTTGVRLIVGMVVVEGNRDAIVETYELVRAVPGVEKFNLSPALTIGTYAGFPAGEKHELLEAINVIHRIRAEKGGPRIDARLGHALHLKPYRDEMKSRASQGRGTLLWPAGRSGIALSATGDVYPEHHMMFPEWLCGNLQQQHLLSIWRGPRLRAIREAIRARKACVDCDVAYLCSRGSPGIAYATYRSLDHRDPNCIYDAGVAAESGGR